jgi:hypothetical protein
MSVECVRRSAPGLRNGVDPGLSSRMRRLAYLVAVNTLVFVTCFVIVEIGFRLFLGPRYWIHTNKLMIGSGQTEAGKKWWPDTTYTVDSSEFHLPFHTNARGYRARPRPFQASRPYRVAFVGDSFTEGMQVPYESTFCARLEDQLNQNDHSRHYVCENEGVSATDLIEYWHRITHDVLTDRPPDALVLCIYPGNDFQAIPPDAAFGDDDWPLRDYFKKPTWGQHVIAWINLHSKFGSYLQRVIFSIGSRPVKASQAPKNWWTNPEMAALACDTLAVRRSRSLLRAIDSECRRAGTRLCVLVVGPVATYTAKDGQSPLTRILASWGIDAPVIDVAIQAVARADHPSMTFPIDGHLNESGHAYVARQAAPRLERFLDETALAGVHAGVNR